MRVNSRQLLLHISGGIAFLLLPVLFSPDFSRIGTLFQIPPFLRDFSSYLLLLIFFYLNYYFFLPKFYFRKKYFLLAACVVISYLIISYLPHFIIPFNKPFDHPEGFRPPPHGMPPPHHMMNNPFKAWFGFSHYFFQFLIVLIFSTLLRTNNQWKQAQKEKTEAELSYLKAQINPHFLFNTLNSIYSSAIGEKADKTANAIVELSGMMRYVMSEADFDFVALDKEIKYINNYIALQKIRLGDTVSISYDCEGISEGKEIVPLILIPFVENAFKHGVNPEEKSIIRIKIAVSKTDLILTVFNNKFSSLHKDEPRSGLGIENTRQRLALLYPANHTLEIHDGEKDFSVSLTIQFS